MYEHSSFLQNLRRLGVKYELIMISFCKTERQTKLFRDATNLE